MAVLERDTLGVREVRLFNAVVRWSEAECQRQQLQVTPENKRKVLGEALALIRFPLMTIEEFAAGKPKARGAGGVASRDVGREPRQEQGCAPPCVLTGSAKTARAQTPFARCAPPRVPPCVPRAHARV